MKKPKGRGRKGKSAKDKVVEAAVKKTRQNVLQSLRSQDLNVAVVGKILRELLLSRQMMLEFFAYRLANVGKTVLTSTESTFAAYRIFLKYALGRAPDEKRDVGIS